MYKKMACPKCKFGRTKRIDAIITKTNILFIRKCPRCYHRFDSESLLLFSPINKYRYITFDGQIFIMHRFVYKISNNVLLDNNIPIHHLNGNKGDCRPENLIAIKKHSSLMTESHSYNVIKKLRERIVELETKLKKKGGNSGKTK